LILSFNGISQESIFRGFIYEKASGEVIPFQKVKVYASDSTFFGAMTDVNGFFSIPKLQLGIYTVRIESMTYVTLEDKIEITTPSQILQKKYDLVKEEKAKELGVARVNVETKKKTTEVNMSHIKLDKKGLERIPSIGGENDIVGAFSVTPGVVTTGDQGGQIYVRGGTPIQNKVLLDGITIYNPFHSIGFFSIFETELVKNVDVYTGGFDARYGGRISSIMDISYRDGNRKNAGGKVSVSPFMAKIVLEGPLGKRKEDGSALGSYVFSGKQSLLDYTSKSLYPGINNGNGLPYDFGDYYGKITLNAGGGSKFSFFGFNNNDKVSYTNLADLNFNQKGGGINFIVVPSGSAALIRGHVNASNYTLGFKEQNLPDRTSSIGGAELGFDFTYFRKNEGQFDVGVCINGFNTTYTTYNELARKISDDNTTFEVSSYVNYKVIKGKWVFQPGFRTQGYISRGVISPEPRLGIKWNAFDKMRFKFSGGKYSQNFTSTSSDKDVVNLFNGLLSAPTSFQSTLTHENGKITDVKSAIQYSWHAILGTEIDLGENLSLNVEGYYKYFPQLSNINQNKIYNIEDPIASDKPDIQKTDFIIETAKTYGLDFLLKYTKNRLFIWGVYSYGKSTRWDGTKTYAPVFDRRHNINLVTSYLFGAKKTLELNLRWNLGSGLPFTPTAGFYQNETFPSGVTTNITTTNPQNTGIIYGNFNSERLPYYHRLDITVKKNYKFKDKYLLEIIASVTNVYNRKNIFYVNRVTNQTIYQFPMLPSLGMSFKF
jgi:hypothetical protein